jgi:hypothetical protein
MSLVSRVNDLAQWIGQEFKAIRAEIAALPTGGGTSEHTHTEYVATTDPRLSDARTPTTHFHPVSDLSTSGGRSATTFLNGSGSWVVPYTELTSAEITAGTASTSRTITGRRVQEIVVKALTPMISLMSDLATIYPGNPKIGTRHYRVTIAGDRLLKSPGVGFDGQQVLFQVSASGGTRTLTLDTGIADSFQFGTDVTSIPPIPMGTTTFIGCLYRTASQRWHVLAVSSGH